MISDGRYIFSNILSFPSHFLSQNLVLKQHNDVFKHRLHAKLLNIVISE